MVGLGLDRWYLDCLLLVAELTDVVYSDSLLTRTARYRRSSVQGISPHHSRPTKSDVVETVRGTDFTPITRRATSPLCGLNYRRL